jgi:uncharacterized protein (TIRG00374 family)
MRLDWRSALGIVLGALLLWWTLHDEPLGQVWAVLAASDLRLFLAATVAATLTFPVRARRWRTILDPVAPGLPLGPLWRAVAVGVAASNVVPGKIGEVVRPYALTRETDRVDFPAAIASIAVDRLFDMVVVLLLLFAAVLDPVFPSDVRVVGQPVAVLARGLILILAALLVLLYAIVFFPAPLIRGFELLAGRVSPALERRGAVALRSFAAGLGVLRHPGRFASVFAWTVAHWVLNALALWLGFRAVGIRVPYSAGLFINGILAGAAAIPSAPGFFGLFEAAAKEGLRVYGVPGTLAVSWALGYHVLTFIPITVFGALYFTRLGIRLREVTRAAGTGPDA